MKWSFSYIQSTPAVFVLQIFDIKLNFCCNEPNTCTNNNDVEKNFAVIKSVSIKSFNCNSFAKVSLYNSLRILIIPTYPTGDKNSTRPLVITSEI